MPVLELPDGTVIEVPAVEPSSVEMDQPSNRYTSYPATPTLSDAGSQARVGPVAVCPVSRKLPGGDGGVVSPVVATGVTTVTALLAGAYPPSILALTMNVYCRPARM